MSGGVLEINRQIYTNHLMGECPKLLFWWERKLDNLDLLLGNSTDTHEGTAVHVWCQPNYVLRGSQVVQCQHGAWEPATPWCGDKEVFDLNIPWIIIIICCIVIFFVFLCSFRWCCKTKKKAEKKTQEFKYYEEQRSKVYAPATIPPVVYHETREPSFGRTISEKDDTYESREPPRRPPLEAAYPGVYHREVHREVVHEAPPPEVHTEVVHHRHRAPQKKIHREIIHEAPREVTTEVVHHRHKAPQKIHKRYEYHEQEGGEDIEVVHHRHQAPQKIHKRYEIHDQEGGEDVEVVHHRYKAPQQIHKRYEYHDEERGEDNEAYVEGPVYGRGVRRTVEQESVATTGGRTRRMADWFSQYRKWYSAFSGKIGKGATKVFRRGQAPTREIQVTEYEDREDPAGMNTTAVDFGATAYGGQRRTTTYEEGEDEYGMGIHRTTYDGGATAYGGQRTTFETNLEEQRRVTTTTRTREVAEGPTYYDSNNPSGNDPDDQFDKVYTWKGGKIDIVEDDGREDAYSDVYDA